MKQECAERTKSITATAVLAAILVSGVVLAAPASASSIGGDFLYKVPDRSIAANCIGSHSTYRGTVNLNPYFDYGSTGFHTTSGNALAVETYEELGFRSAYKYVSCIHGDFYYVYYGAGAVERKVTIVFDCYGGSCMGPFISYGRWSNGWS
ncbi:MAG: hypothetical protein JO363_17920 [Solirubrobacterales bacterium]|nr:hypothetical protein [Solirubrobacterales bacterium]